MIQICFTRNAPVLVSTDNYQLIRLQLENQHRDIKARAHRSVYILVGTGYDNADNCTEIIYALRHVVNCEFLITIVMTMKAIEDSTCGLFEMNCSARTVTA